MGYIVRMPKLGLEMERGTLLEWVADEGESVREGDLVAEVESEKSVADVEAREDGVLRWTFLEAGESVPPGTPIGIVAPADEDVGDLEAEAMADLEDDAEAESGTEDDEPAAPSAGGGDSRRADAGDVRASPRARDRASELGVDLATVEGTGYQGAITAEDVEAAAETGGATRTLESEREFDGMRRTIASRLSESYREAVHVTVGREADAEALFAAADAANDALGTDVSVQDVLLRAVSASLSEHPAFNATFEDGVHRRWAEHNVGIAVDVEQGLIAPVLPEVEAKSLADLADERRALVDRALEGDYTMDDLQGGTFTVTNLGVLGVESFDPIINPPQVAILGVDAVGERPTRGADDGVEWRRHLPFDLTFDHRVVDGADAARFLETLVGHVEDAWPILTDSVAEAAGRAAERDGGSDAEMPGRTVTATNAEGMRGRIEAGSFEWTYDEPEEGGGTETGPTPVDVFLGGFAACLSLSARYQAEKRDVPVEGIRVTADATPEHGSVERIEATIRIDSDADDETIARVVDLAERGCHVSQLLREDLPIDLSWDRA